MEYTLSIYTPKSIKKNPTNYYLFDVFIRDNLLYIIMPLYKNYLCFRELKVQSNNKTLPLVNNYFDNKHEPFRILIYKINNENINNEFISVKLNFDHQIFTKQIKVDRPKTKFNITFSTLCKEDYRLSENFINYYKNLGVDCFIFYLNLPITKEIENYYLNLQKKYSSIKINLFEWNFHYWYYDGYKKMHHIQPACLNHALYKFGKSQSNYMLFCDLDEYINLNGSTLTEFLKKNNSLDTVGFKNIWSKTLSNKPEKPLPGAFLTSKKIYDYGIRSKCLHKVDSIETLNIHHGGLYNKKPNIFNNFYMFHFFNWTQKDRIVHESFFLFKLPIA
jgi:hypothetical protein